MPKISPEVERASAELADLLEPEEPAVGEDPETYVLHPTASKTDLLFACTWPWGRRVRHEASGDRTRFGSGFHEGLEGLLTKKHINPRVEGALIAIRFDIDPVELVERVTEAFPIIHAWLGGGNQWRINFLLSMQTEVSVAYNYKTGEARRCEPPDPVTHEYRDRQPDEILGTADVVSLVGDQVLVVDHKSGWSVAADWQPQTPAEAGQLRTLALALARLYGVDEAIVAFFHAPASGSPQIYPDILLAQDLQAHAKALKQAHANIGTDWKRDGPWCAHCPAWTECSTQRSALVELKRGTGALTSERVGAIHQAMGLFDKLADRLRTEIRGWVKAHGVGVRPDGMVVDLVEKEVSNLSQASILRALGPLEGAKMIAKLDKLGCIEKRPRVELRAVRR